MNRFKKIKELLEDIQDSFEGLEDDLQYADKEVDRCEEAIRSLIAENDKLNTDIEVLTSKLKDAREALRKFGELYE